MGAREAFGPNLRRIRIQRGISLEQIALETKISVELLSDLERNDFRRWPAGIFARSYVRDYARLIGADPEAVVDEFCRWFDKGDRRLLRVMSEHAQIVGHELEWRDDRWPAGIDADRRATPPQEATPPSRPTVVARTKLFLRLRRAISKT
jgi:transcriptional regulator with XRE-family HTH domain